MSSFNTENVHPTVNLLFVAHAGAAIPMFNKRHLSATSISRPQSASTYLHQVTPVTRYAPYASELNMLAFSHNIKTKN